MASDIRNRILDLAVEAIDTGGEASMRLDPILAAVGVTAPTLYYHFGNRDGLVTAAQIERYTRQTKNDIAAIGKAVSRCTTSEELRTTLRITWTRSLAERSESRWSRISVVGSAYARPELATAVAQAQDDIVAALTEILEPCRERGWLRPNIDLASTIAWHHSLLIGRLFMEHGQREGDPGEWDRLTLDALDQAFFGPDRGHP